MPYRDYQKHLEYMRNYHKIHRKEQNLKSKEYYQQHKEKRKLYDKEYIRTHKEERKLYNRKIRKEAKDFLINKHGRTCVGCGLTSKDNYLVFHRKNFIPHDHLTPNQARKLWKEFIPLCRNCHRTLHHFVKHRKKFERLLK